MVEGSIYILTENQTIIYIDQYFFNISLILITRINGSLRGLLDAKQLAYIES